MIRCCVAHPIGVFLIALGVVVFGAAALRSLPVSSLPEIDYPTIVVQADLPGASPETMAATVVAPLEHALGSIRDLTEMHSFSQYGTASIVLRFALGRST